MINVLGYYYLFKMFNLKADIEEKRNKSSSIKKEVFENGDTITKICGKKQLFTY